MINSGQGNKQLKELFEQIDDYWSFQKNNEIYVKGLNLEPGTQEYFDVIQKARYRYLYYLDDMVSWLKGTSGSRLIEVGCGMGMDLAQLALAGFEVTGVDLAKTHVALAKAYFQGKGLAGDIRHGNAERLDFEDETFDCAYSFGVLHHSPNPQIGINEIHRVLKPGGRSSIMLYHRNSLNNLVHILTRIPYDNPKK
ncbi:MAG: class I SAM-dependent methyltransferase, partial [Desulfofustis sp.]|nr:class I SAM-dependent methyltransferase [Desulfofustis sp.]